MSRRMNWTAANSRRRIHDKGAESAAGATFGGNRPPASASPPPAPDRSTSRRGPTLPEPVVVSRFWKNRGRAESVRVTLSDYEGQAIVNVRVYATGGDGIDRPTVKGVALGIRKLPELAKALAKAETQARELGLLDDQDGASEPAAGREGVSP